MDNTKKINFFTINNYGDIEYYTCNINEQALIEVQKSIDDWNDKGELKTIEAHDIDKKRNKFYEIISKQFLDVKRCWDGCCGFDDVKFYSIEYYEYEKHPLSIKCDEIGKTKNEIEFSYILRNFIEWETDNSEELQYQKEILQTMNFQKLQLDNQTVKKIYNEKLVEANPWLETAINKINVWQEIKNLFIEHQDIFSRNSIKKCLLKNLPFSSGIKDIH